MVKEPKQVDSSIYSCDYYLNECDGYDIFLRSNGKELPKRDAAAIRLAGDLAGLRILDVGCGRGEIVRYCEEQGAVVIGMDYAMEALRIAKDIISKQSSSLAHADAQYIPFKSGIFDLVLAFDVVEHLHPLELERFLSEAYRVLRPRGRLIIHTMPNIWYYKFGYPLYRLVQRLRGTKLPRDPRERWPYVPQMHVNEQSIVSLKCNLERAHFKSTIFLETQQDFLYEKNPRIRLVMTFLATVFPFKLVFCNDIFSVCIKL